MLHPLELPEVIATLGLHIPLWRPHPHSPHQHEFAPQDLVACLSVCRTWRQVLTPRLWELYFDLVHYGRIPDELASRQSTHFRRLQLTSSAKPFPIHSTRLRNLSLSYAQLPLSDCAALIRANSELRELEFTTHLMFLNPAQQQEDRDAEEADRVRGALECPTQLRRIFVGWPHIQFCDVVQILRNNPGLENVGLWSALCLGNLPVKEEDEGGSGNEAFTSVESLYLHLNWERNSTSLLQFLRRFPNLEILKLGNQEGCSAEALVRVLQECCPKLKDILCFGKDVLEAGCLDEDVLWQRFKGLEREAVGSGRDFVAVPPAS